MRRAGRNPAPPIAEHCLRSGRRTDDLHARSAPRRELHGAHCRSIVFESLHSGQHNAPLNAFLLEANAAVRQVFHGAVTYAAVPFEAVDWTLFDYIGLDHYRMAHDRDIYGAQLRRYRDLQQTPRCYWR